METFKPTLTDHGLMILTVFFANQRQGHTFHSVNKVLKVENLVKKMLELKTMGILFTHGHKNEFFITHIGQEYYTKVLKPILQKNTATAEAIKQKELTLQKNSGNS